TSSTRQSDSFFTELEIGQEGFLTGNRGNRGEREAVSLFSLFAPVEFLVSRQLFESLLQLRLCVGEGVTLDELCEFSPGVAGEEGAQHCLVLLDEIGRAGIKFA